MCTHFPTDNFDHRTIGVRMGFAARLRAPPPPTAVGAAAPPRAQPRARAHIAVYQIESRYDIRRSILTNDTIKVSISCF